MSRVGSPDYRERSHFASGCYGDAMESLIVRRFPLEADGEWLAIGRVGWAMWHHPSSSSVAFVSFERFVESWTIKEVRFVRLESKFRLQANDLRLLALGRVESMASDPDIKELLVAGYSSDALPVLDPAQVTASKAKAVCEQLPERPRTSSLAISVPPKGQRDMFFYEILDTIYRRAASQSSHPAKDIAKANGVPVTTVHAWLKAMRKAKAEQQQRRLDAGAGLQILRGMVDALPDEPVGALVFEEETLPDGNTRLTMRTEPPTDD